MSTMRAKFRVHAVKSIKATAGPTAGETVQEHLSFGAVCGPDPFNADGTSEDNTYARWTPQAGCEMVITNPNLFGQFEAGQTFYVDFARADR